MNLIVVLPMLATIVSLLFSLMVFDQYLHKHKPYQLAWSFGLLLFSLAAFAQFLGTSFGWYGANQIFFRLWFLCGAIGTSAFLGMGTLFLIAKPKVAHYVLNGLMIAFALATIATFTASVDTNVLPACANQEISVKLAIKDGHYDTVCPNPPLVPASAQTSKAVYALPGYVWALAPIFNIFGAGFFVFGALQSAWIFWRKRTRLHRTISNIIIMLGGLIAASAGLFQDAGIHGYAFSLATLLAVTFIFIGFLISIEVFEEFRVPFTRIVLKQRRINSPNAGVSPEALS
jgi:hypothetical protein